MVPRCPFSVSMTCYQNRTNLQTWKWAKSESEQQTNIEGNLNSENTFAKLLQNTEKTRRHRLQCNDFRTESRLGARSLQCHAF